MRSAAPSWLRQPGDKPSRGANLATPIGTKAWTDGWGSEIKRRGRGRGVKQEPEGSFGLEMSQQNLSAFRARPEATKEKEKGKEQRRSAQVTE